jgi:hypothetical protein
MKNITRLIVIETIVFLVAGIIAFFLGNITFNSYGTKDDRMPTIANLKTLMIYCKILVETTEAA